MKLEVDCAALLLCPLLSLEDIECGALDAPPSSLLTHIRLHPRCTKLQAQALLPVRRRRLQFILAGKIWRANVTHSALLFPDFPVLVVQSKSGS